MYNKQRHNTNFIRELRKPSERQKNKYERNRFKRVHTPRKKHVSKSKHSFKMSRSLRRVVNSSSETLDAWISLLVPDYEDVMKKRREDKLSLRLTLAVLSAITAEYCQHKFIILNVHSLFLYSYTVQNVEWNFAFMQTNMSQSKTIYYGMDMKTNSYKIENVDEQARG